MGVPGTARPIAGGDLLQHIQAVDWEFRDAPTQELTHGLHRYSSKFIPQIAREVIELLTEPGEIVLDPFVGSGTTLVEALASGRHGVGVDLSPLACLISRAKVTPVPLELRVGLVAYFRSVTGAIQASRAPIDDRLFPTSEFEIDEEATAADSRWQDPWYTKWFQPQVLRELIVIWNAISRLEDMPTRELATVAFSDILRRASNAHSGYPNVMFDRSAPAKSPPAEVFLRSVEQAVDLVARLDGLSTGTGVRVLEGDSRALPLEASSVDAIVTHPPYVGSVPYAEYGVLSLRWIGSDPKWLDKTLIGGRRQSADVLPRFESGYSSVVHECERVLRPGGCAFFMVGNPVVRAQMVDLSRITREFCRSAGFVELGVASRRGVNRRANKMGREALIFVEKPIS